MHSEIVMPPCCEWQPSRPELWNSAELNERRKDACVSREHEIALPREMNDAQRLALVRACAVDLAQRHGCAVDFSIHSPRSDAKGGEENWHAHVMCTTRKAGPAGLGEKCDREKAGRDRKADLKEERKRWEEICNQNLSEAGIDQQIDCRSLADQGIADRSPGQHLGPTAAAVSRKSTKEKQNGKRNQQYPENPESRRRSPPPPARGRLRALSECPVVSLERVGGSLLLPEDVQRRLEYGRAEHDFGLRRPVARRSEDLRKEEKEELQRCAAMRQAEAARAMEAFGRLRRRLAQEPARLWGGEGKESGFLKLDGLHAERRAGRTVWRFSKTNIAAVVDHGDSLSITRLSNSRVGAAIQIAREKGWISLVLTGSDEFKEKSVRAALEAGLRIENEELQHLVKQIEKERQQVKVAQERPTPQPKAPPPLQKIKEAGTVVLPLPATPAALGLRVLEIDHLLHEQSLAADHLRSMSAYAKCTNRHVQIAAALQEARSRQREGVKDDPWLREVFSSHATDKLAERREQAKQQGNSARADLEKLESENLLSRLLSAKERKRLAKKIEAAKKMVLEVNRKIQKVEEACKKMEDPKTRSTYRSWAIQRVKERNQDVERLQARLADQEAEREALERRAGLNAELARRLKEEKAQIAKKVESLTPLDREWYEQARTGRSEDAAPPQLPKPRPSSGPKPPGM